MLKKRLILAICAMLAVVGVGILAFSISSPTSTSDVAEVCSVNGVLKVNTSQKDYTVSLLDVQTMATVSETTVKGGNFELSEIPADGHYTLLVEADGFLTYRIKSVAVTDGTYISDVDLSGFGGDINSDGKIDDNDLALLKADYNKETAALSNPFSDLTADGKVDDEDMEVLLKGFGKTASDAIFEGERFIDETAYISPSAIDVVDENNVVVGDETRNAVYKLGVSDGKISKTYIASGQVNNVMVEDGKVYVAEGGLCGFITVLDVSDLSVVQTVEVGHTPNDMLIYNGSLYVANRFSNTISVIDTSDFSLSAEISVTREPMALAVSNGKLYAVHHLTDDAATADVVSAKISVIDIATNTVTKTVPIVNGASGVKDVASDGNGRLYITHVLGRYAYPTTQLDRGWINTNAVTIFDCETDSCYATVLLDKTDLGAANPWGISVSENKIVVALSGVHEAMVIDIPTLNAKLKEELSKKGTLEGTANSLKFLDGARQRVSLPGTGPRTVALSSDGKTAFFAQYFTGDVASLSIEELTTKSYTLGTQPETDTVRKGHILWSDATLCYQEWQSCNSCHPDARVDGLNWDNLNDGIGTHKSAKSMLYSHRTPPVMVTGIRPNAEAAVRAGMKYIQFNVIPEEDMSAIDEYLKSLLPTPSPYLTRDGSLTASAENGKRLFEEVGCVTCHPAPIYTDMQLHNNGIIDPETDGWESRPFDTATLVEVWRSAPYRFNGKFATIHESVVHDVKGQKLTKNEIADLTEYVLSIGAENEAYGIEQVFAQASDGSTLYSKIEPGAVPESFTVRKQDKYAREATVTVELTDSLGNSVVKESFNLPAMKLGEVQTVKLPSSFKVPIDFSAGGTLTFAITETSSGKTVATDFVLVSR